MLKTLHLPKLYFEDFLDKLDTILSNNDIKGLLIKSQKIIEELKKNQIEFRGPLILGKGESVHFKDPDGNHLEIRCPAR